jgi:hypothetical protein
MVVMIRTPFEKRQQRRRHERHSQGYPWDNRTTGRLPGISLGAREDNAMGNRAVGCAQAIRD